MRTMGVICIDRTRTLAEGPGTGHNQGWRAKSPGATLTYKQLESNLGSRLLTAIFRGCGWNVRHGRRAVPQVSPRRRNRPAVRLGVLGRGQNLGGRFGARARRQRCATATTGPRAAPRVGQVGAEYGALGHWHGLEYSAGPRRAQRKRAAWMWGVAIGSIAWLSSYVVLPFAKIDKPIWDYDAETLADDFSAHLVYGVTIGTLFAGVTKRASW